MIYDAEFFKWRLATELPVPTWVAERPSRTGHPLAEQQRCGFFTLCSHIKATYTFRLKLCSPLSVLSGKRSHRLSNQTTHSLCVITGVEFAVKSESTSSICVVSHDIDI